MGSPARDDATYSWDDYQSWDDGERRELIGGEIYVMTPAPVPRHQRIASRLTRFLDEYFEGRTCDLYAAPIDVKLSDFDVVQPDLVVICDEERIKPTHIDGAPTLVIEILSPSTAVYDRTKKLELYAHSGVREVWLVTPYPSTIEVYLLDGATYRLMQTVSTVDKLKSPSFPDLRIDLKRVFDFPLEPGEELRRVKEDDMPYTTGAAEHPLA